MAKDAFVAGFPAGKIGFHGKAGGELEAQAGVVLEAQMDAVAVAAGVGEEFDEFYDPSLGFGEHQFAGLECWTGSAREGFGCELREADGAFSFGDSHVALLGGYSG